MYLPIQDLTYLSMPLPEEVKMFHYAGDFEGEVACIDRWLSRKIPQALQKRLEIQRIFAELLIHDYSMTTQEFLQELREKCPSATEETIEYFIDMGNVDFIMRGGERYFQHQALRNLFNTHHHDICRLNDPTYVQPDNTNADLDTIRTMQAEGGMSYRYEVQENIKINPHAVREGETLRLWFPYPVACATQPEQEIKLISSSHPVTITGDVHRTAYMEVPCHADETYSVRFSFVNTATYKDLTNHTPTGLPASEGLTDEVYATYTAEQYPHIRFTPYIKALAEEIKGDETDPLTIARRVYDWICEHVQYSYVRDYLLIENIPEFVVTNGYGDCGTMALVFITLCRALGIPAKWQSGSSCRPSSIGSHDWCMFYVAPYGWLYCDPSYGVGAVRSGNETRRNYYFGNLDPYRLVASNEFQNPLVPEKVLCRMDPYDNQSGEAEYADGVHNIFWDDREAWREVISSEQL